MEMEYFVPPDDSARWYEYWCQERFQWYASLGIPTEKLRLRAHDDDELSHYSIGTSDVEFLYPWGWGELEGIAQRTDFDLTQHTKFSGQDLSYFDQERDERYVPYVIEPAAGADRATLAFLLSAYDEDEAPNEKGGTDTRTVLRFHPSLAPIKSCPWPTRSRGRCDAGSRSTSTPPVRSGGATDARTKWAPRSASRSTSTLSTIGRSRSATATPWPRIVCRSTTCSRNWNGGSTHE
jgi:glycyl-tRNA synthetase (class II)